MQKTYEGYLKRHMPRILALHRAGKTTPQIVRTLTEECGILPWSNSLSSSVAYALKRLGKKPINSQEQRKRPASEFADVLKRRRAGETLASIGKTYGVSKERIRQMEALALRRERDADNPIRQLPVRAFNVISCCLGREPVSADDVAQLSEADLLRYPNCGQKTVREIKEWLVSQGARLG